jgi:Tfp pilus assembly protein PilO
MKKKIKRVELILFGLWLIIILAVAGYMIIAKASARFVQLDEGITANQEKLARLNAIIKQEKELGAEYEDVFSGYRPIKDSDSLLQEIDAIAKKLNVNITNIKPAAAKEEAGYRYYPIRIDGQDDVYAIAKFLNAICSQIRGVSIERLQFSSQNRDELPKVSIEVNALVFK